MRYNLTDKYILWPYNLTDKYNLKDKYILWDIISQISII